MFIQNQVLNETYQIIRPIGDGGTSSVYLAYHIRLKKNVVIKQLRGTFSADFLMRTEVDILKNLHHPNLPQVYDFIQDQNNVYTIIDFVDGYDLEAYIRSGTEFPEQLLKRYLRQIAEVLDYLHGQNPPVIHSDIKPGNIIINQEGNAILIDFNTSIGGNQGNLLGLTLPYASPEQIYMAQNAASGQSVPFDMDGRSDLYSLGATFYEIISGIQPTPGVPPVPLHTMGITGYSRDFLLLIDRLIEYDRDKRVKSAKKLVAAIDKLDSRYRTYFALRCVSVIVSAALIGGGLYCCIRGARRNTMEGFLKQYNSAVACIDQGYLDQAEDICDRILASDKMQAYLQDEPMELARVYHAMGDIQYYEENYGAAATYYQYAVSLCDSQKATEMALFLRDAAIAYAQYGDLTTAQTLLQMAQSYQLANNDLQLISIVIDAKAGNVQDCAAKAQELINSGAPKDICMRAAMSVASAVEDFNSKIQWLQLAKSYDDGKTATRALAVVYGQKAQAASSFAEQQAMLTEAAALYSQICDSIYTASKDMLNYSVVLRMLGQNQKALEILKQAEEYDRENYRILANMCFIYYEMNDSSNASVYCSAAIQAWKGYTGSDKLTEASEEIQNLLEIGRRFGIGGT